MMKFAVVVFPGSNCDHDAYHAAKDVLGAGGRVRLAQGHRSEGRRRRRSCPAASRTATTCGPARWRASRPIMRAVRSVRAARRPGARHLQRLSDPARSRAAARRDAAQPRPEVPLRARPRPRRADRHAVHVARAARVRCCGMPIAHGEGNYFATPDVLARLEANRQVIFRYTNAAGAVTDDGQPERIGRTPSPASATRRGTSSA